MKSSVTKPSFPNWVMLGYTWLFVIHVTLSKTQKEDISPYENYFPHRGCCSDLYPDGSPTLLSCLIPTLLLSSPSCLHLPCLHLQQLMQKSVRLCPVINGSQFWWLIASASFNHASFICYWIIWKWHLRLCCVTTCNKTGSSIRILYWLAYLCLKSLFLTEDRKAGNRRKNEVLAAQFDALLADWKLDSICIIQCNNK